MRLMREGPKCSIKAGKVRRQEQIMPRYSSRILYYYNQEDLDRILGTIRKGSRVYCQIGELPCIISLIEKRRRFPQPGDAHSNNAARHLN